MFHWILPHSRNGAWNGHIVLEVGILGSSYDKNSVFILIVEFFSRQVCIYMYANTHICIHACTHTCTIMNMFSQKYKNSIFECYIANLGKGGEKKTKEIFF